MNFNGKTHVAMVFVATPDLEAEGDRIFKSHAAWMEETHYQEGEKELLQYTVAKSTDKEGNIHFVVTEVYKTPAGHEDHRVRGHEEWKDIGNLQKWASECESSVKVGTVIDSLW